MKKIILLNLILFTTPVIAGVYGILHDQLTYTISPEYFTKFKFFQFGLYTWHAGLTAAHPRLAVATVGFMASWWTGIFVGVGLGFTSLIYKDAGSMLKRVAVAMAITIGITCITGLSGLAYGKFFLAKTGVSWWLPDDLIDKANFIAVGSMHNFSYLGGFLGLTAGIIYLVRTRNKAALQTTHV